ncbi:MAG: PAS domain-containing protein [Anaerolineae bacterium]|nr:PAS domain-containing protein [Anaerolineae bacterium]
MKDEDKTKAQLIEELVELRRRNLALEAANAECRAAEAALRESEQRLKLALKGANVGLWDLNVQTNEIVVNQRASETLGYAPDEMGSHLSWWDERTHPDDLPRLRQAWQSHVAAKTPFYECEYRLRNRAGEWQWILDRGKIVEWDKHNQPLRATGTHLDITERKHIEETLQKLNRELALINNASQAFNSSLELDVVLVSLLEEVRPLLEVIGASVWLIDPETNELVCHQASGAHRANLRGWRLPPGVGIIGWTVQYDQSVIVPDVQADPRHFKAIEDALNLKLQSILAVPLRSKERTIGVLEVVDTQPHRFTKNEQMLVESLAATATIAIENARLYEQTRRDAETRAVLLQEVNHRTKNNLAAIIGLLHLEQRHDMSEEARTVYQTIMHDLISRIHGLATVHRLLSSADWSPILLSELATKVIHSALQALPLDKNVAVEVSPSPVKIAPKLANTVALIINELTTNTIKYAWPTRDLGCISVRIELENGEVIFEFCDDGPGFPAEVLNLERHSVGWELVQTLVQQGLQGKVSLHNDHGAVTTIRFPQLV